MCESKELLKRKRINNSSLCDEFYRDLFAWFTQTRKAGLPISELMIQSRAILINKKLNGPEEFQAKAKAGFGALKNYLESVI